MALLTKEMLTMGSTHYGYRTHYGYNAHYGYTTHYGYTAKT